MTSKGRLFAKALIESPVISNAVSYVTPGSTIAPSGILSKYDTVDELPLTGNNPADQAYVVETNRLYLWTGTGWYNIALINTSPSITGGYESGYLFETDGTPIEITLVGSDPEGIPLTWSYEVTAGSLTNGGGTTATVSNVDNVFTITPSTTEDYAGSFSLTFKASDGVNLATAVSSFTLAFKILNSNYTTLLAKGTTASQNSTFVDSSTNAHTITANGDVYQGTFSPYRAGGYSMYFDGTGDYLTAAYGADLSLDADFTIECWFYPIAKTSNFPTLINNYSSYAANGGFAIFAGHDGGTAGKYNVAFNGSFPVINSTDSIAYGQWQHVALVRSGTTLTLYLDGIANGSSTQSATVIGTSNYWWIGAAGDGLANSGLNGNISNLRVVKGTAVYTANFTPPTAPLEAITNTSLLINTPYIADSSSNAHAITVNGNTSTQPFSPFDHEAYAAATNGGSAYFDGTGDYILITEQSGAFSFGTGDFTVEFWVYARAYGGSIAGAALFGTTWDDNTGYAIHLGQDINNFRITSDASGTWSDTLTVSSGGGPSLNMWTHYAIVRNGDNLSIYKNGNSVGSRTGVSSYNFTCPSGLGVCGRFSDGANIRDLNGYISNLHVVKGTAVYTSNFTPPTAPLTAITNTSLLLNFTDAGIQDYSQVSDLKTVGNATGSNTQTKYASYSMYFDGTGDYITIPFDGLPFGTMDFTIELWVNRTSSVVNSGLFNHAEAAAATNFQLSFNDAAGSVAFWYKGATSSDIILSTTDCVAGTWYHVAVTKEGDVFRLFINGVQENTATYAANYSSTADYRIGRNRGGTAYHTGYIEDLRITKGLARYTANFTPPAAELLG